MQTDSETTARTNHLRCIGYAIRTIFRVLPALGRDTDHDNPPPGLSFKHFAMGDVFRAIALVSTIIWLVQAGVHFAR